jgi:hypothetical protein
VASAADQLEDELKRLEQQRDRYAMAAETATDPKVSLGHLRNVERLDDEIEAIEKALEAMPSGVEQRSAEQAVSLGFDYGDDDEQTRVFDAALVPSEPAAAAAAQPLARPVVQEAVVDRPPAPPQARQPEPEPAQPPASAEVSSPFGRRLATPGASFDVMPSGPIDLDLPRSGLRRASTLVLVAIVLGVVAAGLWYALQPPARPVERETESTPTVIEAAPVPSDAQHR